MLDSAQITELSTTHPTVVNIMLWEFAMNGLGVGSARLLRIRIHMPAVFSGPLCGVFRFDVECDRAETVLTKHDKACTCTRMYIRPMSCLTHVFYGACSDIA